MTLFLRKPKHKEEVIATKRGWVVKRTGEILARIKDLDTKIKDFQKEFETEILPSIETHSETVVEGVKQEIEVKEHVDTSKDENALESVTETSKDVVEEAPKRRGRKPKTEA